MMDLGDLYQEIILDHNRSPRNRRGMDGADMEAEGYNPLCGDRVTVRLKIEGGVVADAAFEGSGCAISTASASLMTEALMGKTVGEVRALFSKFHAAATGGRRRTGWASWSRCWVSGNTLRGSNARRWCGIRPSPRSTGRHRRPRNRGIRDDEL